MRQFPQFPTSSVPTPPPLPVITTVPTSRSTLQPSRDSSGDKLATDRLWWSQHLDTHMSKLRNDLQHQLAKASEELQQSLRQVLDLERKDRLAAFEDVKKDLSAQKGALADLTWQESIERALHAHSKGGSEDSAAHGVVISPLQVAARLSVYQEDSKGMRDELFAGLAAFRREAAEMHAGKNEALGTVSAQQDQLRQQVTDVEATFADLHRELQAEQVALTDLRQDFLLQQERLEKEEKAQQDALDNTSPEYGQSNALREPLRKQASSTSIGMAQGWLSHDGSDISEQSTVEGLRTLSAELRSELVSRLRVASDRLHEEFALHRDAVATEVVGLRGEICSRVEHLEGDLKRLRVADNQQAAVLARVRMVETQNQQLTESAKQWERVLMLTETLASVSAESQKTETKVSERVECAYQHASAMRDGQARLEERVYGVERRLTDIGVLSAEQKASDRTDEDINVSKGPRSARSDGVTPVTNHIKRLQPQPTMTPTMSDRPDSVIGLALQKTLRTLVDNVIAGEPQIIPRAVTTGLSPCPSRRLISVDRRALSPLRPAGNPRCGDAPALRSPSPAVAQTVAPILSRGDSVPVLARTRSPAQSQGPSVASALAKNQIRAPSLVGVLGRRAVSP